MVEKIKELNTPFTPKGHNGTLSFEEFYKAYPWHDSLELTQNGLKYKGYLIDCKSVPNISKEKLMEIILQIKNEIEFGQSLLSLKAIEKIIDENLKSL